MGKQAQELENVTTAVLRSILQSLGSCPIKDCLFSLSTVSVA